MKEEQSKEKGNNKRKQGGETDRKSPNEGDCVKIMRSVQPTP